MSSAATLQARVTSIMEILARSAVVEIIKLVDESCAVLRSEMSRSRSENEELRMKLKLMERELTRRPKLPDSPADRCAELRCCAHVLEEEDKDPAEDQPCEEVTLCGRTWDMDVWGDAAGVDPALEGDVLPSAFPMQAVSFLPPVCQESPMKREKKLQESCPASVLPSGLNVRAQETDDHERLHVAEGFRDTGTRVPGGCLCAERSAETGLPDPYNHPCAETSPPAGGSAVSLSAAGLPEEKPEADMLTLVVVKEEAEMQPVCSGEAEIEGLHTEAAHSSGESCDVKGENLGLLHALEEQLRESLVEEPSFEENCGDGSQSSAAGRTQRTMEAGQKPSTTQEENLAEESNVKQDHGNSSLLNITKTQRKAVLGEKPYSCMQCGKRFSYQSNVHKHMRIHTGEKPYSCTYCGRRFTHQNNMQEHVRIHTGEKPYTCSACGMSFTRQSSLKRHQRIHTGERPFTCIICGRSFTRFTYLKMHQQINTKENPDNCIKFGRCPNFRFGGQCS